ncbi:MAG TPA: zinc-binding dehydrogenase [Acidimicrobiia bacterium]|nr:zinc-binding dehydrogenase [Acidimicrobiia bacterium]
MRALLIDHEAPHHLRLGEALDPVPEPTQALIQVVGTSLNRGEVAFRAPAAAEGSVLGWDASGIVVKPALDGSGPASGTRVLTVDVGGRGWAELRAVDTAYLTEVPEDSDLVGFAALPVAGLSALRALRSLGTVEGRRILITGASGGVGRFAVQLGARAGAEMIAVASPRHHEALIALGATAAVSRPSDVDGPVFAAIDVVGGEFLPESYRVLQDHGGTLVSLGHAAAAPEVFEVGDMQGKSRTIRGFYLFADVTGIAEDLAQLVTLMAEGSLDPQITWRGSWAEYHEAVRLLLDRRLHGKAVLEIDRSLG